MCDYIFRFNLCKWASRSIIKMNRYFKNFILCGDIHHYCLLCKETLYLVKEIEKHIRWENHRKNIKNQECLPKFKGNLIYKIRNLYYCEDCNIVESNITAITAHVKGEKHKLLKTAPEAEIKKPAGLYHAGFVIINKVILTKEHWNSIVGNKCLICNVEVKNIEEHIALEDHILNLFKSETKYADNQYYRKINAEIYHCFACKEIFSEINFASHFVTCQNKDDIEIKKLKAVKKSTDFESLTEDMNRMEEIEKELLETLQDFYNIDEINNSASCKYCSSPIDINFLTMIEHMKEDHTKEPKRHIIDSSSESSVDEVVFREFPDHGLKRANLAKYGRERHIKMNYNGSKGYCTICDRYLSANKKIFREHAKGLNHKGHLELLGLRKPIIIEQCIQFKLQSIESYMSHVQYSPERLIVLVNDEICVTRCSFFLLYRITKNPHWRKTKCFACSELFEQGKEYEHCMTSKHKENFIAAQLIKTPGEFIRQVRPNLYHCASCNVTLAFSQTVEIHLKTLKHRVTKVFKMDSWSEVNFCQNFDFKNFVPSTSDKDLYAALLHIVLG